MIQRLTLYLEWLCLGAFCLCGGLFACSEVALEGEKEMENKQEMVTFSIDTRAMNYANDPDIAIESQIKSLRLYTFQRVGGNLTWTGYYYWDTLTPVSKHVFRMKLYLGEVLIFAVANEEAAQGLMLDNSVMSNWPEPEMLNGKPVYNAVIDTNDFWRLTFNKLPQAKAIDTNGHEMVNPPLDETKNKYRGALLPMAARVQNRIISGVAVNIELKRSVAKLSLYFAKAGSSKDSLFMGRGLYLYNQPEFGYLFSKQYDGLNFNYEEQAGGDCTDSDYQLGGRVILRAGFKKVYHPDFPCTEAELRKTHINLVTVANNMPGGTPELDVYQHLPAKPIYLFANPQTLVTTDAATGNKNYHPMHPAYMLSKGYFLKVLSHEHRLDSLGHNTNHVGQMHYVALPPVEANEHLKLYSVIALGNYWNLGIHWMVVPWKQGGGAIEFN